MCLISKEGNNEIIEECNRQRDEALDGRRPREGDGGPKTSRRAKRRFG